MAIYNVFLELGLIRNPFMYSDDRRAAFDLGPAKRPHALSQLKRRKRARWCGAYRKKK